MEFRFGMHTDVSTHTAVCKLDGDYDCSQPQVVTGIPALLERIDAVLKTGKFASERAWCKAAGLSPSYISSMRGRGGPNGTGEVHDVKHDKVAALARAAGLDPSYLLGEMSVANQVVATDARSTFQRAVDGVEWPGNISAPQIADVIQRARIECESTKGPELPVQYWEARLIYFLEEARTEQSNIHNAARRRKAR